MLSEKQVCKAKRNDFNLYVILLGHNSSRLQNTEMAVNNVRIKLAQISRRFLSRAN